jgi:magnesium-transporting ATPase (P-type)
MILMFAESIQGAMRTVFLEPRLGQLHARQLGVFTGAVAVLLITYAFSGWIGAEKHALLLKIGVFWLSLTVAFEVVLGRLLGRSWKEIGSDYNFVHGGLLVLGLTVLTLSPLLVARLRKSKNISTRASMKEGSVPGSRQIVTKRL